MRTRSRRFNLNPVLLLILGLLGVISPAVLRPAPAGAAGAKADVGMPFTGGWAYNVPTDDMCGSSNAQTSHPSCHEIWASGYDWSVDLHAAEGTAVILNVTSPDGPVTFSLPTQPANGTCGQKSVIKVLVNNAEVGLLYYEHMNNAVRTGAVTNGMTIGSVKYWGSCNAGPHIHMEFKNTAGNRSCYTNHSNATHTAGMTINQGTSLGVLGSANTGIKEACAGAPSGGTTLAEGNYVKTATVGTVYVIAGGARVRVPSFDSVGGPKDVKTISDSEMNSLGTMPRDGTYVHDYGNGTVYVVAGRAAVKVPSFDSVGGPKTVIQLPAGTVNGLFGKIPVDGTYVKDYGDGTVYVIAGGARVRVPSFDSVGGPKTVTELPVGTVGTLFTQYPANGTFVVEYGNGTVYVVAGGMGLKVTSWENVGGPKPVVQIPAGSVTGQLRAYPIDGTHVRNIHTGAIYKVQGGKTTFLSSWGAAGPQPFTNVDPWAIANQLHATGG
jgi:hypothetical protein